MGLRLLSTLDSFEQVENAVAEICMCAGVVMPVMSDLRRSSAIHHQLLLLS